MGANGHILIWADDVVRKKWADCDILFNQLPFHYCHKLDEKLYHHVYTDFGQHLVENWNDENDWYLKECTSLLRLEEFIKWLENNATWWEVWTK